MESSSLSLLLAGSLSAPLGLDLSAASECPYMLYMLIKNTAPALHPEVEVANMYLSPKFFLASVVVHHVSHLAIVRYWWHR